MAQGIVRIGIMGGTFDPIHNGHLFAAESARESFHLEHVYFVPTGISPHKLGKIIASPEDRYQMTAMAVLDNPFFSASRAEIDRAGISYSVDTIIEISDICMEKYERFELFFITGADSVLDILTWKDSEKIIELCSFIAVNRNGYSLEELKRLAADAKQLGINLHKEINILQIPPLTISSTDIRRRIKNKLTIKYLLPSSVETYIMKNCLYR